MVTRLQFRRIGFACDLTRFSAFTRRPSPGAVCLLNISYSVCKVQMHWGWSKAFGNARQLMQAGPENCPARGKCTWMSAIETGCAMYIVPPINSNPSAPAPVNAEIDIHTAIMDL